MIFWILDPSHSLGNCWTCRHSDGNLCYAKLTEELEEWIDQTHQNSEGEWSAMPEPDAIGCPAWESNILA